MRRVVKVSRIRIIITIIVVVLTTLLTGCTGKEPNEIAYVVALGIDSTDDDNYKITIQYANTTQISGGASESGGKSGSEIVDYSKSKHRLIGKALFFNADGFN